MPTPEEFFKKYANLFDPHAKACQTEPGNSTGEICTVDTCLPCSTEKIEETEESGKEC